MRNDLMKHHTSGIYLRGRWVALIITLLMLCIGNINAQHTPIGIVSMQDSIRPLQVGLAANVASGEGTGVQVAGFSNMSAMPFHGAQLGGVSNVAAGIERGAQVSALLNVSSGYMRGLQFAAYNYADSLNGQQLGLINVARTHPKGWQVGILNITHDTIAHKLGLVNINPKTTVDFMFFTGTSIRLNAAMRFRNRSTYNEIGIGTHYQGLGDKFSGALYYRVGQYFNLTPRLSLSGDVGYSHIETFLDNSDETPDRLFSLQARLNVDYQLTKKLGVFATVGYGKTWYYHDWKKFRDRLFVETGISLRYNRNGRSQQTFHEDNANEENDYGNRRQQKSHTWWALAEVTAVNAGVHLFDRCVTNQEYAQTTLNTWQKNFKNGFVWDNDQFSTNLFMHPYHGNLYYNSARSQGLNLWQSAPFAMLGSLQWEFLGEIEPPAVNDLIATTLGGICIGEVANRASKIFLNDKKRGWARFASEAAAFVINPMNGVKRLVTGDAWRVRDNRGGYYDGVHFPLDCSVSVGDRYLADNGALFRGEHNPYINLYMEYGDPINEGRHNAPYDFFDAEVTFGLSANQPIINALHLLGRLWSRPLAEKNEVKAEFGIYQHFNYFDSKPVKEGSDKTPYRISEAASVGPGFIFEFPAVGSLARIEQRVFLSGILLGGTKSDYYNIIDRDYNMGSGYSVKSKTHIEMRNFGRFILNTRFFQLYTWKGYEGKDLATVNPLYLNSQGNKGHAHLLVVSPITEIDLRSGCSLLFSASYFSRTTHYKQFPTVRANTFEVRFGLVQHF